MADTKMSAFTVDSTPDDADWIPYVDKDQGGAGVHANRLLTFADLKAYLGSEVTKVTTSTQTSTSTTPAADTQMSGDSLDPGTYSYKAHVVWQGAATTTGISLYVRGNGGTVTRNCGHHYTTTTGGAATTGIADQATVAGTFQMIESRAWRANNTDPGPHGGVDTANADQFSVIEGVIVVTATTTLQLMYRSEVAGSGVSIMAGSTLKYERVD